MIEPKDVIARLSVEELIATSDEYYRVISDPTPLMVKPFAFLHETPEMLQNLGYLLSGLHLGKTMTVLDFGAGTCWLSRFMAQLNCQPVCCDTSASALAIGKRLFDEWPLIGTAVYKPVFLLFDGHHIDLPDSSIDRIVCFDAFHHVPNQGEVLKELARVLKPGGIAGFSEPGRQHSRAPQAQYEMRNYKVLENDIVLEDIFELAKVAGFTDLTIKVMTDRDISLGEYQQIYNSPDKEPFKTELFNSTYNTMFSRSVFFLHKGALVPDSRNHVGLAHSMGVDRREYAVAPGAPVRMSFHLRNTGTAAWLHENSEIFGIVRLASHLYDMDGQLLNVDFSRHALPRSVAPGEAVDVTIELMLPDDSAYRLTFDLVAEGVTWFENQGSQVVGVIVRRT